jgi:hypothetical protein
MDTMRMICHCRHADPIPNSRDAQRPQFAIGFGNEHPANRVRSISPLPERQRQFIQPPLHAVRFDVGKVLTVYARHALVGAALSPGMRQNVQPMDLVVQGVEAIAI